MDLKNLTSVFEAETSAPRCINQFTMEPLLFWIAWCRGVSPYKVILPLRLVLFYILMKYLLKITRVYEHAFLSGCEDNETMISFVLSLMYQCKHLYTSYSDTNKI